MLRTTTHREIAFTLNDVARLLRTHADQKAAQFGMTPAHLGSLAMIGGALGRSMSPVAAAAIIAAGLAGVNPVELTKRNAIPMLAAAVAVMLLLGG